MERLTKLNEGVDEEATAVNNALAIIEHAVEVGGWMDACGRANMQQLCLVLSVMGVLGVLGVVPLVRQQCMQTDRHRGGGAGSWLCTHILKTRTLCDRHSSCTTPLC